MKFKISGEIEAENEEEARYKATVSGGIDFLDFEEEEEIDNDLKCSCGNELMSFTCRYCQGEMSVCVGCGDSFSTGDLSHLRNKEKKGD